MKARMICCVCGKFLYWTETYDGRDSHGLCKKHFKEAMREVDDAFRRDKRQQKEE